MNQLKKDHETAILLITHDMDLVAEASKRVIVMDQGEVVFDGEKDKLFKDITKLYFDSLK